MFSPLSQFPKKVILYEICFPIIFSSYPWPDLVKISNEIWFYMKAYISYHIRMIIWYRTHLQKLPWCYSVQPTMRMYINQLWEQECESIGTAWIEREGKSQLFTMALPKHNLPLSLAASLLHRPHSINELPVNRPWEECSKLIGQENIDCFDQLWECKSIICAEWNVWFILLACFGHGW